MSCLGVCMAALASPEVGNLLPTVDKDEECDKDSGHHSGEEMDCVINPEIQVRIKLSTFWGLSQQEFVKISLHQVSLNESSSSDILTALLHSAMISHCMTECNSQSNLLDLFL